MEARLMKLWQIDNIILSKISFYSEKEDILIC